MNPRNCLAMILSLTMLFSMVACHNTDEDDKAYLKKYPELVVETDDSAGATDWEMAKSIQETYSVADTESDRNTAWTDSAECISLSNQDVLITKGGAYVLSGTLQNGQVTVQVSNGETVHLILNGATVTCNDSAPIYVKQADKVILTLAKGTVNTLTDGNSYAYDNIEKKEPNGAIFCKSDLTINGEGSLTVNANFNNGIVTKNKLKILGGTVTVNAVNHGIKGKDCVAIRAGSVTVNAGGNGIQSENGKNDKKGFLLIEDGNLAVTAGQNGLEAASSVAMIGGTVTVKTHKGSAKGIKGKKEIKIAGGMLTVDALEDGLHTNGNAFVGGGNLTISSGDDGIHADKAVFVTGGLIRVDKSYEGIEAVKIQIDGGKVYLTAKDDGINANGGTDGSAKDSETGQNQFNSAIEEPGIVINGGYLVINAAGDGLDANGVLSFHGGCTLIYGPTDNGNGALDADKAITVTGGILLAVGAPGMAAYPDSDSSTQPAFAVYTSADAGTLVQIRDGAGNAVFSFAPLKKIQSVVFSAPFLQQGAAYDIYVGGQYSKEAVDGICTGGNSTGGSKCTSVTLSDLVAAENGIGSMIDRPGRR